MKLQTLKPKVAAAGNRLATIQPGSWRSDKQSSTQRGYDYWWQKARKRYLEEHPLCVYCERESRVTAATVVDHKIPHRGDLDLLRCESNWQPLCKTCHDSVKQREEAQQGQR